MNQISYWEVEELAAAMLGVHEQYENETLEDDIESLFYDKFDTSLEVLAQIVEKLAPMAANDISPLTDTIRSGFVYENAYIVKVEK